MNKTCTKCSVKQDLDKFSFRGLGDVRHAWCKLCIKSYDHKRYIKNRVARLNSNKERRVLLRTRLIQYMNDKFCITCGEDDFVVLEFDHRDRKTKKFDIGIAVGHEYAWERILDEIKKCDVRCANCHRRRTAIQLGWYKNIRDEVLRKHPSSGN